MGCFMPSSERWDVMHFAFMFGGTYAPIWMTASTRNGKTWRFLKMANSKVILVLPITCSEPFAWFESLACPLSRFLKCNWPNNVFQKCSNFGSSCLTSAPPRENIHLCAPFGEVSFYDRRVRFKGGHWAESKREGIELGTNKLVNEIFDDTLDLYVCECFSMLFHS